MRIASILSLIPVVIGLFFAFKAHSKFLKEEYKRATGQPWPGSNPCNNPNIITPTKAESKINSPLDFQTITKEYLRNNKVKLDVEAGL